MAAMNAARSASGPRMLALPRGRNPRLRPPHANCDQCRRMVMLCRTIGSTVSGVSSTKQRPQRRRHGITLALSFPAGPRPPGRPAARPSPGDRPRLLGQLPGGQRLLAQEGEEVQFGGRPQHAGRLKAAHQLQDFEPIREFLLHGDFGLRV